jgi:Helix-hairpin-helix motif
MAIPRSLLRFVLMSLAVVFVVIGLNNCSSAAPPQASAPAVSSATSAPSTGEPKININSAILSELDKLEAALGVPALSNRIQASRPYSSVDDLVAKQVITADQFTQIKDRVTVEDIVLTGEAKDVDYMTKLGLMKGHMLVAAELLALGLPDQAEPHLGHPVEEIYVDIQDQLPDRQVKDFSSVLTKVQDLVKSKPKDPQVKTTFDAAMVAIDQAIAALPAAQRQDPAFSLQVINEMLDTAAAEYTAAISDGKISAAIEYQDSRGFVQYAKDTLLKAIQPQLATKAVAAQIPIHMEKLYKAWPTPVPPQSPIVPVDQVVSQVKDIEKASIAARS